MAVEVTGPRGIGGWLILPLLGLFLTPIWIAIGTVQNIQVFRDPAVWSALTSPGSPDYHPLWAPVIIFEIAANVVMVAFAVVLIWLFLKKSRRIPTLMIVWLVTLLVVQIVDQAFARQIPAVAAEPDPQGFRDMVRAVIGVVIWVPYFLKSKRVKNTFVE